MEIINNPHDKFFKKVFSDLEVARDFILNYLPGELLEITDTGDMEVIKDSFVEKELKETFSDLLYRVKINNRTGYLYLLFEHKSYPYKLTAYQLLRYMTNIWDLLLKQKRTGDKLPVIVPLVFYHGVKKWNIELEFADLLNKTATVDKYIPDFRYLLYDFSKYSEVEILGDIQLRLILSIMHNIYRERFEEELEDILVLLNELGKTETVLEYFEVVMRYIINVRETPLSELKEKVDKTIPERGSDLMTLAEKLREEGKLEGRKEGRKKELEETIIVQLCKKFNLRIIPENIKNKIETAELEQLKRIRDNIFEIESLEEVEGYL